jgi:hypothetical protein
MLSIFRDIYQWYLILGTNIAIDEIIVRFFGRLVDTYKMLNKPIKQGYKIFALATNSYIWHFQLSLRQYEIAKLEKVYKLISTRSIVL